MADDWGCFNVDPDVIQGLIYPKMKGMTTRKIQELIDEYNKAGLLFLWDAEDRTWGYFVSWDSHHNYCNKTNVDNAGKNQKHRRKTPEPPNNLLVQYLQIVSDGLGRVGTPSDEILSPIPNPSPIPSLNPNPKKSVEKIKYSDFVFLTEKEYQALIDKHGEIKTKKMIEVLSNYKGSSGKKYESDYHAILSWVVKEVEKEGGQQNGRVKPETDKYANTSR